MFYWELKRFFTADPEFSIEKYPTLPYEYVINAYANLSRMMRMELHAYERPIALQTQLTANMNIDKKKHKKLSIEEFYVYQPIETKNLPEARYGAAVQALIQRGEFPAWGLFCYKDLVSRAKGNPPDLLCFRSDEAILVAPVRVEIGYKGLLIALEEASGEAMVMTSPCGQQVTLSIPFIHTKIIAKEDVVLPLVN
jgi:hypothetical protein